MSKKFETPKNLEREERAIKLWTKGEHNDCYEKLGEFDPIDYRVFSKKKKLKIFKNVGWTICF